jgi:hypothetical protein
MTAVTPVGLSTFEHQWEVNTVVQQSRKQTLVWGLFFIFLGLMMVAENIADLSAWIWVAALVAAGVVVFGIYLADRSEWGLLIMAYVLWAVAGLVALTELDVLQDESIATYVLAAIGLPFLGAFLRDRTQWWALIPAYVLLVVGLMVGLIGQEVLDELLIPAYVMFAIAIPFLVVFGRDTQQWWALIPGGIMAIIGLAFLVAQAQTEYVLPAIPILIGVWILLRQVTRRQPSG